MTGKHGMRRARYRGKPKVRLQALFSGAAANLKRMAQALAAEELALVGLEIAC
jgi:IS5 family transposase